MKLHKISQVILEIPFTKSPPKDKFFNKNSWHERHFALVQVLPTDDKVRSKSKKGKTTLKPQLTNSFHLMYWHDEQERRKGSKPIRIISLSRHCNIHVVAHPLWPGKFPHVLRLNTPHRNFYFCAENKDRMYLWFETIQQVIEGKFSNEKEEIKKEKEGEKEKENSNEEKWDPIYATLFPIDTPETEFQRTSSGSSSESNSLRRSRLSFPSESSCLNWNEDLKGGKENRDSGISLRTQSSSSSTFETSRRRCHSNEDVCRFEKSASTRCDSFGEDGSYIKMESYLPPHRHSITPPADIINDDDIYTNMDQYARKTSHEYSSPVFNARNRDNAPLVGAEAVHQTMPNSETSTPTFKKYRSHSAVEANIAPIKPRRHLSCSAQQVENRIPVSPPSDTCIDFNDKTYDVPTLINKIQRIRFHDIVLEVPQESSVKITKNELSITTSSFEWKLSRRDNEDVIAHL